MSKNQNGIFMHKKQENKIFLMHEKLRRPIQQHRIQFITHTIIIAYKCVNYKYLYKKLCSAENRQRKIVYEAVLRGNAILYMR